jgi:chorismate lyase/3-hydroxybenzoate synthase
MRPRHAPQPQRSTPPVLEAAAHLQMDYVASADLSRWLADSADSPLAIVSFGAPISSPVSCPTITLDLPQLDGRAQVEVWTSDRPVTVHRMNEFSAATSGETLAGTLQLEEEPGEGLQATTERAYRRLLQHIQELGYPHLWRVWNFFPDINDQERGLERYRQFCIGRHQALAGTLQGFPSALPAGTAVGTRSGPLQLYVLAGTHPAAHLGNPRQVHAYEYPEHYGPCSPSFARATLLQSSSDVHAQLFISGTASIVGHESLHPGLPESQTRETIDNLQALLDHADELAGIAGRHQPARGRYKVYVRRPDHLKTIRQALSIPLFASSQILYLQGDLCRKELLVEIEGVVVTD